MLSEQYHVGNLGGIVLKKNEFKPFAGAGEREMWESLPDAIRADRIARGEKYLNFQWPLLSAAMYMDYVRTGTRSRFEDIYFKRRYALGSLVLAECVEGNGRFIDDIINGIWCVCEESAWNINAHNEGKILPDAESPIIDLFAAETGALLSWAYYLLKQRLDSVSPLVCKRIAMEVKRRISDPYLFRDDFWWMSFHVPEGLHINNWNPWCNSNCLAVFLFLEEDEGRRIQAVEKSLRSIDKFIGAYHADGGCDEGTSYWNAAGGALFDYLELLYLASDGKINFYEEPLIKNIGRFIFRSHISGDYFINFADGGARVDLSSELVYRYGSRIGDEKLASQGLYNFRLSGCCMTEAVFYPMFRVLSFLVNYKKMKDLGTDAPFVRDVWLEGIQVMAAREQQGLDRGLYLAAKGGHNNESHNHNDVGQFIVYSDGKPAIIDVGVETYTAKTFGPRRYEIWTMQSAYHNLPAINGFQQQAGKEFMAAEVNYISEDSKVSFSFDISPAYPPEAGIKSWRRVFEFYRTGKSYIEITEDFVLCRESEITLSLMAAAEPSCTVSGAISLPVEGGRSIRIEYPPELLAYSCEKIAIQDAKLQRIWGDSLYRILLKAVKAEDQAKWSIKISQFA